MKPSFYLLLAATLLVFTSHRPATADTFHGLGALPFITPNSQALGVSGDGAVVFGMSASFSGGPAGEPFRWTRQDGMTVLPNYDGGPQSRFPNAASYDGSVIVGTGQYPFSQFVALQWDSVGTSSPMASYSTSLYGAQANAISGDGSIIVGTSDDNGNSEAVMWTNDNISGLGDLPDGLIQSEAYNISSDGTTVVGSSYGADYVEAFRWTSAAGMIGLGTLLPGGESSARALSANGAVIVGNTDSPDGPQAFRWTEADGMVGLGDLPGGVYNSFANDITADGVMISGNSFSSIGFEAVLWRSGSMVRLVDYLDARDVQGMDGWSQITVAGMSDDGRVFVGTGFNSSGYYEAWIVTIPEPSSAGLLTVAALVTTAISNRRTRL
jgi:probable HAF family extracellular repeat protein